LGGLLLLIAQSRDIEMLPQKHKNGCIVSAD